MGWRAAIYPGHADVAAQQQKHPWCSNCWEHEKDKTARYLERRKVSGKQDWPIIGREKGTEFACMF